VVDWGKVAKSDVAFAILKATEGGDYVDETFARNLAGAEAAGLVVGAYHFFTFCRPGEEQALSSGLACRVLMARGITGPFETRKSGIDYACMRGDIETIAGLTLEESSTKTPRFKRWQPHPTLRGCHFLGERVGTSARE
jgi:glycosyl hydrolase family 25